MTTIAFQKDELCADCGNLTNPKIGWSTCTCTEKKVNNN
jgi:hypothetical protein